MTVLRTYTIYYKRHYWIRIRMDVLFFWNYDGYTAGIHVHMYVTMYNSCIGFRYNNIMYIDYPDYRPIQIPALNKSTLGIFNWTDFFFVNIFLFRIGSKILLSSLIYQLFLLISMYFPEIFCVEIFWVCIFPYSWLSVSVAIFK